MTSNEIPNSSNSAAFSLSRMHEQKRCLSEYEKLWTVFAPLCEQYGILYKMPDIITAYKADYNRQMTLF